ncbi:MAG: o-succinylbenzoate synthase [Candidatus Omnitrophota bacterium]|jgi:O-succinylbenzoate synthase|nr:MAG: o-succinylbenzoate synthase [Candidatus Omnitrophota bacterium]
MSNQINLIHVNVPMTEPFRISSGVVDHKDSILIHIQRDGLDGFGEASPMAGGFYSYETPESTFVFLRDVAVPKLIRHNSFSPHFVEECLQEHHHEMFAWAGLEGALWDLRANEESLPIMDFFGIETSLIESGLAVGIYPTFDELIQACSRYLIDGYKRLKIKIQPGWDLEPLRAVKAQFPDIPLMVDANAAYTQEHFSVFEEIDQLELLMIEQPLPAGDLEGHCSLQTRILTPICLDESATDLRTLKRAFAMQACKIVNIKIQRVGGLARAVAMYDFCTQSGIPVWMGTMPELGIASIHALYLSMLPNCVYPTDVEASRRWFVEDVIDPPIEVVDGVIEIPEAHQNRPTVNFNVIDRYTIQKKSISF